MVGWVLSGCIRFVDPEWVFWSHPSKAPLISAPGAVDKENGSFAVVADSTVSIVMTFEDWGYGHIWLKLRVTRRAPFLNIKLSTKSLNIHHTVYGHMSVPCGYRQNGGEGLVSIEYFLAANQSVCDSLRSLGQELDSAEVTIDFTGFLELNKSSYTIQPVRLSIRPQ
jgi:hypothetical protein